MNNDTLLNIASEFGTPLYVYDAESIKNQYQNLIYFKHIQTTLLTKTL